jgi:hypothetical protein
LLRASAESPLGRGRQRTDHLDLHGDALSTLAEVLTDRPLEAASALEQAAKVCERKENVVSAARARAARDELLTHA